MFDILYLAWRYLAYHRVKTVILVLSITLILFIPSGLQVLVDQSQQQLTSRAEATPLLIGAKGSPLELVLNSLYFSTEVPDRMTYAEVDRVLQTELADPLPLYVRFHSRGTPIVGTSLDYFAFRGLQLAQGRWMGRLGDCVVGAGVAAARGLEPGQHVVSSPESVLDLAGVYPLRMRITGTLTHTGTPDDDAVFVDVKTAWIIEGLAHGHEDLSRKEAAAGVLRKEGTKIIANASVRQYNEITDDNIGSFHFHGDTAAFPLTAIMAVPRDAKSGTLLMGRYLGAEERHQILQPRMVVDQLLATILTIQSFVLAALVSVAVATLATAALVFMLSLRLRKREIETLKKIGVARARVVALLASEIGVVLVISLVSASALTLLTSRFGAQAIRLFIQ